MAKSEETELAKPTAFQWLLIAVLFVAPACLYFLYAPPEYEGVATVGYDYRLYSAQIRKWYSNNPDTQLKWSSIEHPQSKVVLYEVINDLRLAQKLERHARLENVWSIQSWVNFAKEFGEALGTRGEELSIRESFAEVKASLSVNQSGDEQVGQWRIVWRHKNKELAERVPSLVASLYVHRSIETTRSVAQAASGDGSPFSKAWVIPQVQPAVTRAPPTAFALSSLVVAGLVCAKLGYRFLEWWSGRRAPPGAGNADL